MYGKKKAIEQGIKLGIPCLSGKKSQLFMFAALILIVMFITVFTGNSTIASHSTAGTKLVKENYVNEARTVIDRAIFENKNIASELLIFHNSFLEYSEDLGIEIETAIIYSHNHESHVVNYLKDPVLVNALELAPLEAVSLSTSRVEIEYKGSSYTYELDDAPQLKVFFIKK